MRALKWRPLAASLALASSFLWSSCRDENREPPRPTQTTVTLAGGTQLVGTLQNTISTDKTAVGAPVSVRTTQPLLMSGVTVVPAGSLVHGSVTHVRSAGRMKGAAELTMRFTQMELPGGQRVALSSEPLRYYKKGDGKETAAEIGGGAAVGGILGGVVGGKDGALKGGAIGAAVGTGVAVATPGEQIVLAAGHVVHLRLAAPVAVQVRVS